MQKSVHVCSMHVYTLNNDRERARHFSKKIHPLALLTTTKVAMGILGDEEKWKADEIHFFSSVIRFSSPSRKEETHCKRERERAWRQKNDLTSKENIVVPTIKHFKSTQPLSTHNMCVHTRFRLSLSLSRTVLFFVFTRTLSASISLALCVSFSSLNIGKHCVNWYKLPLFSSRLILYFSTIFITVIYNHCYHDHHNFCGK